VVFLAPLLASQPTLSSAGRPTISTHHLFLSSASGHPFREQPTDRHIRPSHRPHSASWRRHFLILLYTTFVINEGNERLASVNQALGGRQGKERERKKKKKTPKNDLETLEYYSSRAQFLRVSSGNEQSRPLQMASLSVFVFTIHRLGTLLGVFKSYIPHFLFHILHSCT
jgi:hypothetical protein